MASETMSSDKAERQLERLAKRSGSLTPAEAALYAQLRAALTANGKLDAQQTKALRTLGKKP